MGSTGYFDVDGALAGVTLGGNYQIGQIVVGAEGDIDWQNVRGALVGGNCTLPGAVPASCASASNWVGTFRARLGFAMDRVLLYATGGGAVANIKASLNALPWASSTELGWSSGVGVEVAMTDNWTAKAEYMAVGFEHVFLRAGQLPCRSRGQRQDSTRTWPAAASIINSSYRRPPPSADSRRPKGLEIATRRNSAGLLFFCTIQGLTEALYWRPKPICRLRLRVPYEAS